MRDQLRDMIAVKMHAVDCGCADWTPDSPDVHTPDATDFYLRLAAAALEPFAEVTVEGVYQRNGWTLPADTFPQFREATHRVFLARTAPQPIAPEETPHAQ